MPTELLPIGTGPANSADVVVTGPTMFVMKSGEPDQSRHGARLVVQIKDDAGAYWAIGEMTGAIPALVVVGPGTYRLQRRGTVACGAFQA